MDEDEMIPIMTEVEIVEAIAILARSYTILRSADQDSRYDYSDVSNAIKRMAKRLCKE